MHLHDLACCCKVIARNYAPICVDAIFSGLEWVYASPMRKKRPRSGSEESQGRPGWGLEASSCAAYSSTSFRRVRRLAYCASVCNIYGKSERGNRINGCRDGASAAGGRRRGPSLP